MRDAKLTTIELEMAASHKYMAALAVFVFLLVGCCSRKRVVLILALLSIEEISH